MTGPAIGRTLLGQPGDRWRPASLGESANESVRPLGRRCGQYGCPPPPGRRQSYSRSHDRRGGHLGALPIGPFTAGDVDGYVETDPDDLRADDRRFFAFRVRSAPTLATSGSTPFFLSEAIPVLIDAGRVRLTPIRDAEILISVAGIGVTEATREGRAVVVLPPNDPALLPGLNRALTAAGIPWRYGPTTTVGEAGVTRWSGPVNLDDIRIRSHYTLMPETEELNRGVLATLSSGEPGWWRGPLPEAPICLLPRPWTKNPPTSP